MTLDVVVPTYNRSRLLRLTLGSLLRAPVPPGLRIDVYVVDNNSVDDTADVVKELAQNAVLPIHYLRELKQGSSSTRNAGVLAGRGELVGFVDDDEEVDGEWFRVIAREFADPETTFIGGPYLPNWVCPVPPWLPPGYHAVIGAIPPKPRAIFDEKFDAILMGGNAVLRRSIFDRVGLYATHLGRSGKGLLSEEDAEFYRRMQAAGLRGIYVPDLAIHHYIAPERLTRNYHRRWAYWRAASQGVADRDLREPVRYFCGVPRYRFRMALGGLLLSPFRRLGKNGVGRAFASELAAWDLAGFIYGKHFARIEKFYATKS